MSLNNSTLICMIVMIIYLIQSKFLGNIIAKLAPISIKGNSISTHKNAFERNMPKPQIAVSIFHIHTIKDGEAPVQFKP